MGSKAGISPTAMLAVHSGKGNSNLFFFFSRLPLGPYAPRESSFYKGHNHTQGAYFEGGICPPDLIHKGNMPHGSTSL